MLRRLLLSFGALLLITMSQGFGQSAVGEMILRFTAVDIDSGWEISRTKDRLTYSLTDTMDLCQYDLSARLYNGSGHDLNTFQLYLEFQEGWDQDRLRQTREENAPRLKAIRKRIIQHCKRIKWQVKTNRDWVEEMPMRYVQLVKDWSGKEKKMIGKVRRLPNYIVDGVGVFADVNVECVEPEEKQALVDGLYGELKRLGVDAGKLGWWNELY